VSTSDNVPNQDTRTIQESQSAGLPLLAAIFSLDRGVSFKLEGILLLTGRYFLDLKAISGAWKPKFRCTAKRLMLIETT
jgi:hypothetical protein